MLFPRKIREYRELGKLEDKEGSDTKWGIDSRLYYYVVDTWHKRFSIVADLSVYHIDNMLGQRKNWKHFKGRVRWKDIDNKYVDYLRLSKEIGDAYIPRHNYNGLRDLSNSYKHFRELVKKYFKDPKFRKKIKSRKSGVLIFKPAIPIFKITSPLKFPSDRHIKHGSCKIVEKIPEWARNNSKVIIEQIGVKRKLKKGRTKINKSKLGVL